MTMTQNLSTMYFKIMCSVFLWIVMLPLIIFTWGSRLIVFLLAKILRPDLSHFVDGRSVMYGRELVDPEIKYVTNILVTIVLDGNLTTASVHELVLKALSKPKWYNSNLTNYVTSWGGFLFWKKEPNFSVKNHIQNIWIDPSSGHVMESSFMEDTNGNASSISEDQLRRIESYLLASRLDNGKSPWDVFIVPRASYACNNGNVGSIMLLNFHHSLADGMSLQHLLTDILNIPDDLMVKPVLPKRSTWNTICYWCHAFLLAPLETIKLTFSDDRNALLDYSIPGPKETFFTGFPACVSVSDIKQVKDRHGVGFLAVVNTCIVGGLRQFMKVKRGVIPDQISVGNPLPNVEISQMFGNQMLFGLVKFPMSNTNSLDTLKEMNKMLMECKNSPAAVATYILLTTLGCTFHKVMTHLYMPFFCPALFGSDFAGPTKQGKVGNRVVTDVYFRPSFPPEHTILLCPSFSYNNKWRLFVEVDSRVCKSPEEAQELANYISEEFNLLKMVK